MTIPQGGYLAADIGTLAMDLLVCDIALPHPCGHLIYVQCIVIDDRHKDVTRSALCIK